MNKAEKKLLETFALFAMCSSLFMFACTENVPGQEQQESKNNQDIITLTVETAEYEQTARFYVSSATAMDTEKSNRTELTIVAAYDVPQNNGFKSYMSYKSITCWKQKDLQEMASTSDSGFRMTEERYCVAVGTHFNVEVGQYIDLILENDVVISCVVADIKADIHTDADRIFTVSNGCCSEFVVDESKLPKIVRKMGDISYFKEDWNSQVKEVIVYDKNILREKEGNTNDK